MDGSETTAVLSLLVRGIHFLFALFLLPQMWARAACCSASLTTPSLVSSLALLQLKPPRSDCPRLSRTFWNTRWGHQELRDNGPPSLPAQSQPSSGSSGRARRSAVWRADEDPLRVSQVEASVPLQFQICGKQIGGIAKKHSFLFPKKGSFLFPNETTGTS